MSTKASSTTPVNQNVNRAFQSAKFVELGVKGQPTELFVLFSLNPEFKVPMNLIIGSYTSQEERDELAKLGLLDDKSKVKELHNHDYVQTAISLFNEEKTWYMENISNVTVPEGEAIKIEFDSIEKLDDAFGLIAVLTEVMARAATQKRVTTINNKIVEFAPQLDEAKVMEILSAVDAEGNPDANSFTNLCNYIASEGGLVEVTPEKVAKTTEEPVVEATTEATEQVANIETVATEEAVEETVATEPENNPAMTEPISVPNGLVLSPVSMAPIEMQLELLSAMHAIDSKQLEELQGALHIQGEFNTMLASMQAQSNELGKKLLETLKGSLVKRELIERQLDKTTKMVEEIKQSLAPNAESVSK